MRYAILCNGTSLNAWEAAVINHLSKLDSPPQLVLAIIDDSLRTPSQSSSPSAIKKLRSIGISNLIYYFYCRYFFKPTSTETVPLSPIIGDIEQIRVNATTPKKGVHRFPEEAIQKIKSKNLDFILRFGFNILKGEILNAAQYGVWSFHHDDEEKYRGGPPAFWEIFHRDCVTGSILQRLTERLDSGTVLKKGYLKTVKYSAAKNLDQIYWETAKWPALVCKEITLTGLNPNKITESKTSAKIFRNPGNLAMIRFLAIQFLEKMSTRFRNWFRQDIWSIGILKSPIHDVLLKDFTKPDLTIEHSNKNSFLADPFGISSGKDLQVFCEEYSYANPVGKICHFQISDTSFTQSHLTPNLEFLASPRQGFHRSYPYAFSHEGASYILPECHQSKRIELWKLDKTRTKIDEIKVLIDGVQAVDPTFFKFEDLYWLGFTLEDVGPNSHLYLWHASHPFGPWEPHQLNPVKIDVRSARPAGTVFTHEGKTYRPSQDCSIDYGYRIRIHEILKLSPSQFEERETKTLGPFKGNYRKGVHTISSAGPYTLIDMKRKKTIWPTIQNLLYIRTRLQVFANSNQV